MEQRAHWQYHSAMEAFTIEHASVRRDGKYILEDVSIHAEKGEQIAIIGPNGAGKSTLIDVIARRTYPLALDEYRSSVLGEERWMIQDLKMRMSLVSPSQDAFFTSAYPAREIVASGLYSSLGFDFHHAVKDSDWEKADAELEKLLLSYEADFGKHASARDVPKLFLLWHSIPEQFAKENRHFIYGEVRQGARAKDLEDALQWLIQAHLIRMVSLVETPEMPLEAVRSRKIFKLYPTDVGILRKLAKLPLSILLQGGDLFDSFKGKLAETYVLEQLLAQRFDPVCYWANSRGTAEVDFLIQGDSGILPVEVKSGLNLKSKSLKVYRSLFSPPLSVRTSLQNLRQDDGLLNIPLPLLGHLSRFLQR